jgi:hypothetical protein
VTATRTARPRTFLVGIFTGLFGISTLLALVVIAHADVWWRWLLLALPLSFAALVGFELRRSIAAPDEGDRG